MTDNLKGIVAILASAAGFVTNDAIVKLLTEELPNGQIIFIRGIVATAIMAVVTTLMRGWRSPAVFAEPAMLVRLVAAAASTLLVVAALRHLPLSTTNAVLQVAPLVVTAGAALLLGAHVGWRRWTASLVGLLGVLLVIKPGTDSFTPAAWLALACLMASATRDLTTRFVDRSVPSILVTFAASAVVCLAGLALYPFEVWIVPSVRASVLLLATSCCLFVAYHFGVVAMRTGEIPVVAPFRYASILGALALGYAFWGHVPDIVSLVGIALIVGAGLYILYRERGSVRRSPEAAQAAAKRAVA
ncbi:MAG: DMT family transporter [Hyphomicrobiaceae bacterium]